MTPLVQLVDIEPMTKRRFEKLASIAISFLLSYSILCCNIIITPYLLNVRTLFFSAGMHADLQSCKFLVFSKMAIYLLRGMVNKL